MSSHTALYAPLRIEPARSMRLAIALLAVHCLAVAAVVILPVPFWGRLGLGLVLLLSLGHGFRLHIVRNTSHAIHSVVWDELGIWRLTLASGETLDARLLPDSFVTLPLVVLNFNTNPRRRSRSLILSGDAVHPDLLRKLRVRLKLEYGKAAKDG